jgi:hypothetical protein
MRLEEKQHRQEGKGAMRWSAIPHCASPVTDPTMLNRNGQVAALIETAELGVWRILPDFKGARHRRDDWPHLLLANSQRRACAAGRVLVGGSTGLLVIVGSRHLGRVAELGRGIVVVRIVLGVWRLCPHNRKCHALARRATPPAPQAARGDAPHLPAGDRGRPVACWPRWAASCRSSSASPCGRTCPAQTRGCPLGVTGRSPPPWSHWRCCCRNHESDPAIAHPRRGSDKRRARSAAHLLLYAGSDMAAAVGAVCFSVRSRAVLTLVVAVDREVV